MAENEEAKKEDGTAAAEKPKSLLKWIVMGVVVVALAAGGFVGYRMFFGASAGKDAAAETAEAGKAKETEPEKGIICPMDSFIVNLMDRSGQGKRYLKTTIQLEVADEENQMRVKEYEAQLRDTILLLLSSQTFDQVSTLEGKLSLKQALLVSINQFLGANRVRRLYFTEFVVQ